MRGVLDHPEPALTKRAGRFVWLELNLDQSANRSFLATHPVRFTPTFFVIDPVTERATATHFGSMSVAELARFLDDGERSFHGPTTSAADSALARADADLGRGDLAAAVANDRAALALAGPQWPARPHAVAQLVTALRSQGDSRACAETAAAEAPHLPRSAEFVAVVEHGLLAAVRDSAAWGRAARVVLVPLAAEALERTSGDVDARMELDTGLCAAAELDHDAAAHEKWKRRWLADLDSVHPQTDDERTAVDIARVEAASELEEYDRFVPALEASERAMPKNYVPSLRLAQVLVLGKRYDEALAACERGLGKVDGPLGRSWLHQIEAEAWLAKGDRARALAAWKRAREAATAINSQPSRENNLRRIDQQIVELDPRPK